MSIWTLIGLVEGKATTKWPAKENAPTGTTGIIGMPDYHKNLCDSACKKCSKICPSNAIDYKNKELTIDYGKCVNCQLCVDSCTTGALSASKKWAFGTSNRKDLILDEINPTPDNKKNNKENNKKDSELKKYFKKSLHIRHVDAGSCNGCESELHALHNPFYNLERLGIFFTPSPRHADLLLVTGPVTYAMHQPLIEAYNAMPEPKWVMAIGTCAVSGGITGGEYSSHNGLDEVIPVDFYLPGCAPNPAAIISALLTFLERQPAKIKGGKCVCS